MELEHERGCSKRPHLGQVMGEERACKGVSGAGENHSGRVKMAKTVILSEFACECWKILNLVTDFLLHRIERGCLTQGSLLIPVYRCHLNRSISSALPAFEVGSRPPTGRAS